MIVANASGGLAAVDAVAPIAHPKPHVSFAQNVFDIGFYFTVARATAEGAARHNTPRAFTGER